MKKEEFIERYGEEAWRGHMEACRRWEVANPDMVHEQRRRFRLRHPDTVKANEQERCHPGGKYYEQKRQYQMNGVQHERNLVRGKHNRKWRPYKQIIAFGSQIHHQWYPETANYRGVALVEKDQHMHGFIDVIQILEGEITLLTEEEVRAEEVITRASS